MKASIQRRAWVLGCVLAMEALGCGGSAVSSAPPKRPVAVKPQDITCAKAPQAGQQVLCLSKSTGQGYVVGLSRGHGWRRKDRVLLTLPYPGMKEGRPVAMGRVMDVYDDTVRVSFIYQIPGSVLDGSDAKLVLPGERVRLNQYVGRVEALEGGRARMDIGEADGVQVGDLYTILDEEGMDAIARLQVTEVKNLVAWGKILGWNDEVRVGMDVQYSGPPEKGDVLPITIVVVNFEAQSAGKAAEIEAGEGFARDFNNALAKAAEGMESVKVVYEPKERVKALRGEDEGHKEARQLGERLGADVLVWGTMRCGEKGCALPRFTVVKEGRLSRGKYEGGEIWMEKDAAGFKFRGEAPEDPLALGAAMLGEVFFNAERYKDAKYYLSVALRKGVLKGVDALRGRRRMVKVLQVLGQSGGAREQALRLEQEAKAAGEWGFETVAWARLAELDELEGKVADAREGYTKVLEAGKRENNAKFEGYGLHALADLEAQQGRVEEAKKLNGRSLELARQFGSLKGEAATLHALAGLEARKGRVEEAKKLYGRSLVLWCEIGDVKGEAALLHALAGLEVREGRVEEAKKLYGRSLELKRQIGNVQGEAATLHQLARLEAQQGRLEEAKKLYDRSLELKRQIGDVQGEVATLHQLARLEAQQGRLEEAKKLYGRSLELKRQIGDVEGEIAALNNLAALDWRAGRRAQARKSVTEALAKARAIQSVRYQAHILENLGQADFAEGLLSSAKARFTESLALFTQLQMPGKIQSLTQQLAEVKRLEQAQQTVKPPKAP